MPKNETNNISFFLNAFPSIIAFTSIYLFINFVQNTPVLLDDPYITYRYAENWAAGHGPVYNIGEYVEGYSSFLAAFVLTIGALLKFDLVVFPVDRENLYV